MEDRLTTLESRINKKADFAAGSAIVSGLLSLGGIIYTYMAVNKKPCGCSLPKANDIKKPVEPEQRVRNRQRQRRYARR